MRRLAMVAAAAVLVTASSGLAGTVFTAKVTEGGRDVTSREAMVKGWLDGDRGKVEFVDALDNTFCRGCYLLTTDGGATGFLVNPHKKTSAPFSPDEQTRTIEGAGKETKVTVTDPSVVRLGSEPGVAIAGLPTTRHIFAITYTLAVGFSTSGYSARVREDVEIWTTTALNDPGFSVWLRKTPPGVGDATLDDLVRAEMSMIEGLPIKRKLVRMVTDNRRQVKRTTSTVTLTEVKPGDVPPGTFALPQ